MKEVTRNFLKNVEISKHLQCIICQDVFVDPMRLNCGCIITWINENSQCPICKMKINKKQTSRDLIAYNILNDMLVTCNNHGCPWKSKLSDLNNHIKVCQFDEEKLSDNIKKHFEKYTMKSMKEAIEEGKNISDDANYFDFNNKNGSLKSRLFSRAPEMMGKVLNSHENKSIDFYDELLTMLDVKTTSKDLNVKTNEENISDKITPFEPNKSNIINNDSFGSDSGETKESKSKDSFGNINSIYISRKRERPVSEPNDHVENLNSTALRLSTEFNQNSDDAELAYAISLSLKDTENK